MPDTNPSAAQDVPAVTELVRAHLQGIAAPEGDGAAGPARFAALPGGPIMDNLDALVQKYVPILAPLFPGQADLARAIAVLLHATDQALYHRAG
jgi:hypothetical protein